MKTRDTFAAKLLQYIRDNSGVVGSEVHKHFKEEATMNSISSTLVRFQTMGLIENRGNHGRYSNWYAVEFETPTPEFLELAREVLFGLKNVPPSERERSLALYLQNLVKERL